MLTVVIDSVKIVRGQGMPSYRHHDFGNLYIHFNVKFPAKNWTQDERALETLREILPVPSVQVARPAEARTEPANLEDVDAQSQNRVFGRPGMDGDDEDGHPGAERVQCATQ